MTSIPQKISLALIAAAGLLLGTPALAQTAAVTVDGAWARATVQGQKATGAFMSLTARESTRLVGVSSPAAGIAEVHEMKLEADVMKMRAVPMLDLPAGQTVQLRPGSYHVMLMDLKQPLVKDSKLPLTLRFKNAKGVESKLDVMVPVALAAPAAGAAAAPADAGAAAHKH